VQTRFVFESADIGPGLARENEAAFSIARARVSFSGSLWRRVGFLLQLDFGKGGASLKDAYADFAVVEKTLWLRAGQGKRPFSRQQITSSGRQQFVDRAITDRAFGGGRDLGVSLHGDYEKSPKFEWVLGVWNGSGDEAELGGDVVVDLETGEGEITGGKFSNVPVLFHPTLAGRIGVNAGEKVKGYSESDLEGGAPRFSFGLSGILDLDADRSGDGLTRAEADLQLKAMGFSTTAAFYVATAQAGDAWTAQALDALGAHAQFGFLIADHVEPAFRWAWVGPVGAANDVHELLGGLSVYIHGHELKVQLDGETLIHETPDGRLHDARVRAQTQFVF
jgi:phosphate-selective porin OprO/OprP